MILYILQTFFTLLTGSDFVDMLYDMLKDRDVLVVQNVIMTLNDLLSDEVGSIA